ncbi:hypothetical protein DB32_005818 [Sandaracinus amylolyticus]|uniref:Uncharacterized protein n=1 Tax=Sandaracinus amylolyticus TaxID=927083 RepID=A0A0F6SGG8_9BACT|nr:hypothetical protein DB32_005818 [Sandaracinus amylolyticus]
MVAFTPPSQARGRAAEARALASLTPEERATVDRLRRDLGLPEAADLRVIVIRGMLAQLEKMLPTGAR